jgi:hypothetical protein
MAVPLLMPTYEPKVSSAAASEAMSLVSMSNGFEHPGAAMPRISQQTTQ